MSSKFVRTTAVSLAAAATAALLGACVHRVDNQWPKHDQEAQEAVVTPRLAGDPQNTDRLKAYHKALQGLVGTPNLEDKFIGCIGCDKLSSPNPPAELKYVFFIEHKMDLYAFTKALDTVEASALGPDKLRLTLVKHSTGGACPAPPPACWPIPSCVSTNGCDANKLQPGCQPC